MSRAIQTQATVLGFNQYSSGTPLPVHSYSPFDIQVIGFSAYWHTYDSSVQELTFWHDDATVGSTMYLSSRSFSRVKFATPEIIPGVTEANISSASRFGFTISNVVSPALSIMLEYEAVNPTDANKQIHGIGSSVFAKTGCIGKFGSLWYLHGHSIWAPPVDSGTNGEIFYTPYEITGPGIMAVDETPVAATPMARAGIFDDFKLVVRDPAGPNGVYTFHARRNGVTEITIGTTLSSTKVWTPTGGTSIANSQGDMINLLCSAAAGTLHAQLIYSWRAAAGSTATLGAGESAGEY